MSTAAGSHAPVKICAVTAVLASLATWCPGATIFFGEDAGAGGSLPVPNSAAAQASFLASLTNVRVEDFEGIPVGTQFPFNVTFGADTATLTGTNTIPSTGVRNTGLGGRFAISGSQYLNVGTADAGSFTLTFSAPQAAFGFYGTDIGDIGGQLVLSLDGGPPVVVPHTVGAPSGAALFFGIIDVANPFTTVHFSNTTGNLGDAFGFDDFTIGRREQVQTIPEPLTLTLGGLTLAGLGGYLRRRRRA